MVSIRMGIALAIYWFLVGCQKPVVAALGVDDGTVEWFKLRGVVVRLERTHRIATIKHGTIVSDAGRVWMEPMTMDFPIALPQDFDNLSNGGEVTATVASRRSDSRYWLEGVREVK
ncbi:MAG TPA: copper-binding protein [Bryobacteraceae bacterium]|nr:copper-binding protein [Bryobacteraceae bacterium]